VDPAGNAPAPQPKIEYTPYQSAQPDSAYNQPEGQPQYGAPQGQPQYGAPQGQPQYGAPQGEGQPQYGAQPPQQDWYPQQQQQFSGGAHYYSQPPSYNYNYSSQPGGYTGYAQAPAYQTPQFGPPGMTLHPRVATAPSGLTIPVTLQTSISTQVAKDGDFVQASISTNVPLQGLSYIPSGSVITGQITHATAGRMMERSGQLSVEFNKLQLPDGESVPIQAHVLGDIGKYQDKDGVYHGEGFGTKAGNFALRAGGGAGLGAALGTALGAIAGGRIGTGAWAGAAIGGGLGAVDSLFLRKGRNVLIQSGTPMQIQLDAPVQVPVDIQPQFGAS
jgi:hypothetical protein